MKHPDLLRRTIACSVCTRPCASPLRCLFHSPSCVGSLSLYSRFFRIPSDNFEVEDEDAVKDRHQEQRYKGCHGESADLRITERLPEGPSFKRQWDEGQDGR